MNKNGSITTEVAASLLLDHSLYPRHQISDQNVRDLQRAHEAGAKLPSVIADTKTRKVVDGFHRVTRATKYDGEEAKIQVEWRTYANDGAIFLDAVRLNSGHGLGLNPYDKARVAVLGKEEFHLEADEIASALGMTTESLSSLEMRKTAIGPDSKLVPIKRTLQHFAGRKVTRRQLDAQKRADGHHQRFILGQTINLLSGDLLDREDDTLLDLLEELVRLGRDYLRVARKKKAS